MIGFQVRGVAQPGSAQRSGRWCRRFKSSRPDQNSSLSTMMAEGFRATIRVSGVVQGVGYRAFVERAASALGLRGYCMNLSDGRVEVVVEGDREQIERLVKQLWEGPRMARVSDVRVEWGRAGLDFSDFVIRHM